MSILRTMQPAFTAGELSPSLWARVDLSKYQTGLKLAKNVIIHPHGGASNRAGFEFIGRTVGNGASVLIPFVFDAVTNQTYNLEFGNQVMRVYRAGSPVLDAAKTITGISGSAVTAAAHGYANGREVFISGIVGPTNINGRNFIVRNVTTNTFTLEDLFGNAVVIDAAYVSGGSVRSLYQLSTPYSTNDIAGLTFAQENDVMYLAHQDYAPRKLSRLADNNWTIETLTFLPDMQAPTGLDGTAYFKRQTGDTTNIQYRVTSVSASNAESAGSSIVSINLQYENEDGRKVRITWDPVSGADSYKVYRVDSNIGVLADTPNNTIELDQTQYVGDGSSPPGSSQPGAPAIPSNVAVGIRFGEVLRYKVAAVSADTGEESLPSSSFTLRNDMSYAGNRNVLNWNAVTGASKYIVYREDNGRYGYIGTSESLTFTDENITVDLASGPQEGENPFNAAGDYPGAVGFFQQRLAFGGTENIPAGVWLGQSSNYENFGSAEPLQESDSIAFRIRSKERNQVLALAESRGLAVFTSAGEFIVSGASDEVLTPTSISIKRQSNRGISNLVQPISVGDVMLFAQARGGVVRDFSYEFANDTFTGKDLTILSRHLFEGRSIVSWAYAQAPDSVIWCVFDDGGCASLTYMREHDVWAWTQHETDGVFERVNVVPEDDEDKVYFVIRRSINSATVRYIERMHTRQFNDIVECFFVDSGLSADGAATASFSGLHHLEGETIVALADGNVYRGLTVTNGKITFPSPVSVVHAGLSYKATMQTLAIDVGNVQGLGTTQGRFKSIAGATIRVEESRAIKAGPSLDKLREVKQRRFEAWDEAIQLFTGDFEVTFTPEWDKDASFYIQQEDPVPMSVLAVMPDLRIGG